MVVAPSKVREIERAILPNGIRIVTETMPYVRSVSLGVWIGSGSRVESGPENGISHFLEHMVFKGTRNRTAEEIARSVDSVGGGLDAFTSKELVSFNTKVLDEHLLFTLDEAFLSSFWKGHGLGKPILGTKETVKKFNREMLWNYYERVYSPKNILITAAGNLDHDRIVELVREKFAGLAERGMPPVTSAPKNNAAIVMKRKDSLEQVHIALGVPSYPLAHELRFPMYVLNTVLGGGMSSRLFQNIREKQGLAYAVYSELNLFSDTGYLLVYA